MCLKTQLPLRDGLLYTKKHAFIPRKVLKNMSNTKEKIS